MSNNNKLNGKEITGQSGKFAGLLQQAIIDALQKKAQEIAGKDGVDLAYWRFTVTLKMEELSSDFAEALKTTVVESDGL